MTQVLDSRDFTVHELKERDEHKHIENTSKYTKRQSQTHRHHAHIGDDGAEQTT